jgi:predicted lipoprotein with Yx(FWY)xxD motif
MLLALLAGCGNRGAHEAAAPAAKPPATITITTARGPVGVYLTDAAGRALYLWDADREGSSTCYDACAAAWPPVTVTDHGIAGPGAQADLLGTQQRKDGTRQVTYDGWPLYYFAPDVARGELSGQADTGFGAIWWLLTPAGQPLTSEPIGSSADAAGSSADASPSTSTA